MNKVNTMGKVAVAMSGGLDSSFSANLLIEQGFDVFGIFMRLSKADGQIEAEDAARLACRHLGIPFYPVNVSARFESEVVDYFLSAYASGQTPNPCVRCNNRIKFGELLFRAKELGANRLATGHYAQIVRDDASGLWQLRRAVDRKKDQSYFLYHLNQDQLSGTIFPLGGFSKEEIRAQAEAVGLPYLKKESQDICFLSGDHNDFLRRHLPLQSGDIVTLDGRLVGRHQGLPLYTLGQRKGIDIGGIGPFYAAGFDYENNILLVAGEANDPALFNTKLSTKASWVAGQPPARSFACQAAVRYHQEPASCQVQASEDVVQVVFTESQRAMAIGQSVVFYQGDEVLGGGEIQAIG
jgi:tRNA-uridine 2-sulfurtransferase